MAHATDKPATERRIHVLPVELLERVRAYQAANGIPSEVEAVRRLLSEALQARDTIDDIMKQVRAYFAQDKDLRALARDVLSGHTLVTRLAIDEADLSFGLRNGDAGQITRKGEMKTGNVDDDGAFYFRTPWPGLSAQKNRRKSVGLGYDLPNPNDDLPPSDPDEEIPF